MSLFKMKTKKVEEQLDALRKQIEALQMTLEKQDSDNGKNDAEATEPIPDNNGFETLMAEFNDLKINFSEGNALLIKENEVLRNRLDEKQERFEQIVQASQEDRYRKDKVKLINKYIYHMDLIRKTLYDFDNGVIDTPSENEGQFWRSQIEALVKGMEATLLQEMVEVVVFGKIGDPVNPDYQETLDLVATDNPELDGRICASINPGYVWTLPYILKAKVTDNGDEIKHYRFLLRPEQIAVYKYNKQ